MSLGIGDCISKKIPFQGENPLPGYANRLPLQEGTYRFSGKNANERLWLVKTNLVSSHPRSGCFG
jgi:hypothetical protein